MCSQNILESDEYRTSNSVYTLDDTRTLSPDLAPTLASLVAYHLGAEPNQRTKPRFAEIRRVRPNANVIAFHWVLLVMRRLVAQSCNSGSTMQRCALLQSPVAVACCIRELKLSRCCGGISFAHFVFDRRRVNKDQKWPN